MNQKHLFESYPFIKILGDLCAVSVAWLLAFYLRFYTFVPLFKEVPVAQIYTKLLPLIWLVWGFSLFAFGEYRQKRFFKFNIKEIAALAKALAFAMLIFIATTFFFEEYKYSRVTLAIFYILQISCIGAMRVFLQYLLFTVEGKNSLGARILLIAHPGQLRRLMDLITDHNLVLGHVIGIVPIGGSINENEGIAAGSLLAMPSNWVDFISEKRIETVVVAIKDKDRHFFHDNLEIIASQVSEFLILPDFEMFSKHSMSVRVLANTPILDVNDSPLKGYNVVLKRLLDILGAIAAILIFSPVLVVASFLVRIGSKGPVFYRQHRMGMDGRTFSILKFRSMPISAEQATGAVWATANDQRATKVGKFLRKTSLDELPQLFNVLKGQMSLVGPRPERPIFVDQFRRSIPKYMLRHKVKAGMTGWAQVNGWRGDTSIERRIEHDLYYIQNWSIWLDIKILFLTIFKGFTNPNAY